MGSLLALVSYPALVEPYVGIQAQARAWSAACLPFVLLTLAVDAFSGDSIPVHLLTREAFQLYFLHLRPGGLLAVHISDRYLDLAPVVGRAAQDLGKQTLEVSTPDHDASDAFAATWVLVTGDPEQFRRDLLFRAGKAVPPRLGFRAWTDDYSNLFQGLD